MSEYRRHYAPGGWYFFTVVTAQRRPILSERIGHLRQAFRAVRARHPFRIEAIVVLPDHLHCVWSLPEEDADFSRRWGLIKGAFSRVVPKDSDIAPRRRARRERGVWQRRFWEHAIRDEGDLRHHVDYIHYNPVKHGYVGAPVEWPHSSFHRFVKLGIYTESWGGEDLDDTMEFE